MPDAELKRWTLVSSLSPTSPYILTLPGNTNMQQRVRFNSRARQGSHKKKAKRGKDAVSEEQPDPNAPIVALKTEEERDQERRAKMREEVSVWCF